MYDRNDLIDRETMDRRRRSATHKRLIEERRKKVRIKAAIIMTVLVAVFVVAGVVYMKIVASNKNVAVTNSLDLSNAVASAQQQGTTEVSQVDKQKYEDNVNSIYEQMTKEDPSKRQPKYVNGILLVNKQFPLPSTFTPGEDQEALSSFNKMVAAAGQEGIYLHKVSSYRSYDYQVGLYNSYVKSVGKEQADTFSARPGFSEHQSGLAFDIGGEDRALDAMEGFGNTKESEWLKNNAYKYGFILRFPEGKEWKTGYEYEAWHYRYVGVDVAKNFINNNLTLEEYLGV